MSVRWRAILDWFSRKDRLVQFEEDERAFTASEVLLLEAVHLCVQQGWAEFARFLIVARVLDLRAILRKVRPNESACAADALERYSQADREFRKGARLALKSFGAKVALDSPHSKRPLEVAAEQLLPFLRRATDELPEHVQGPISRATLALFSMTELIITPSSVWRCLEAVFEARAFRSE